MSAYGLDTSQPPFYDLTPYELSQGYIQVLCRPGFVVQARELNVAQGLLSQAVKDVGDQILKDGAIVEGLELTVIKSLVQNTFSLTAGKVYINGRIWSIPAVTDYPIGSLGQAASTLGAMTIDVDLVGVIVTEIDDDQLLSPADGFSNETLPGAHRLKAIPSVSVNSPTGVTIYRLLNGEPLKLPTSSILSQIGPDLDQRIYDVHGNFLVTGLTLESQGEDLDSFDTQPVVKSATGVITPGVGLHPYGPSWTNRITTSTPNFFTIADIGRKLIIAAASPNGGTYTITDFISANEIEVNGQLLTSASVTITIKDPPQNLAFLVEPGKAYVLGSQVILPTSRRFSSPKALTGRRVVNEPHTLTFGVPEYEFFNQPFKNLIVSGFEGITVNAYLGIGCQSFIPPDNNESGWGITTSKITRGAGVGAGNGDLVSVPGGGSLVKLIAISSNGVWEWHLDPDDADYPGKWKTTPVPITWSESTNPPIVGGWKLNGNSIEWYGADLPGGGAGKPPTGTTYKVIAVVTKTFEAGKDFRIRSNAVAKLFPRPSVSRPVFFPQSTFDLQSNPTLTFYVDGVRVFVDFVGNTDLRVANGGPLPNGSLAATPIAAVESAINMVANAVGKPGVATTQYETTGYGWIVLQSTSSGLFSTLSIPAAGGNDALGFPSSISATGATTPVDMVSFGAYRMPSLIAGSGGSPLKTYGTYSFEADYEYGLARKDVVLLDSEGQIIRREGVPEILSLATVPDGTLNTLSLGSITTAPQSSATEVVNYQLLRLTMAELRADRRRLEALEYNDAVQGLDRGAVEESGFLPTDLAGVLSDGFTGFSKADVLFSENGVDYDVAMDIGLKEILLPQDEVNTDLYANGVGIDAALTTVDLIAGETMAILPKSGEANTISQLQATEFITLNSLGVYGKQPKIRIGPRFDNYPHVVHKTPRQILQNPDGLPIIQQQPVSHRLLNTWVGPRITGERAQQEIKNFPIRSGRDNARDTRPATNIVTTEASDTIVEEARTLLRRRYVKIRGEGFMPNEDNLELFFDDNHIDFQNGTTLALTPPAGFPSDFVAATSSAVTGLIKAKSDGTFHATFQIPLARFLRKKIHILKVRSRDTDPATTSGEATTHYRTWLWRKEAPEDSASTAGQAFFPRKPALGPQGEIAPLAQTFAFEQDKIITSVDLFFGSVGSVGAEVSTLGYDPPIIVQIRNVLNGVPGNVVYAEEILKRSPAYPPPAYPLESDFGPGTTDPVTGNAPKKVTFRDPVFCAANQDYALVLLTQSRLYTVAVGRVGGIPLGGGKPVATQPLNVGKLFTSQNGTSWTADENADLKFIMRTATFTIGSGKDLVFNTITPSQSFTRLLLAVESSAMQGTTVGWYYSTDAGSTWVPVNPNELTDLNPPDEKTTLKVKGTFLTTISDATPFVLKDTVSVSTRRFHTSGNYVTKKVTLTPDSYSEVRQTIKANLGESGAVDVYFGYDRDDGTTEWIKSVIDPLNPPVALGNGFTKFSYRTNPTLPGPDHTSSATLISPSVPQITNPVFDLSGLGDNTLGVDVVYWDENNPAPISPNSKTVTVNVTFVGGVGPRLSPLNALHVEDIAFQINAAAQVASIGLAVDLSAIASLTETNQVALIHPQAGGPLRNKLTISTANVPLGWALNDFDGGGRITAASDSSGGTLTPGDIYHYLVVTTDGVGESQDVLEDIDALSVTVGPGDSEIAFTFADGAIDARATNIKLYRADGHNLGASALFALTNWKNVGTFPVVDGVPTGPVLDTTPSHTSTTKPPDTGLPATLSDLTTFRGRIALSSPAPGSIPRSSPLVQDFTNIFVRTV